MRTRVETVRKHFGFWCFVGSVAVLMTSSFAQAQQPMDMMSCGDSTATTIVASEELTIMGIEGMGINLDNLASKTFDNMTYHTVGLLKIDKGKLTGTMYSKYMDPSGDFPVVEISQVGMNAIGITYMALGNGRGLQEGGKPSLLRRANR